MLTFESGERFQDKEMDRCLQCLMGPDFMKQLPAVIDGKQFAEQVLGFEAEEGDEAIEA